MTNFDEIAQSYKRNYSEEKSLRNIYFRRRLDTITKEICCGNHHAQKIADLGCGSGEIIVEAVKYIVNAEVTLVDKSEEMLGIAKKRLDAYCVKYKAITKSLEEPLRLGKQDKVLIIGVIAYLSNLDSIANTCRMCLNNKGTTVIIQLTDKSHPIQLACHLIYKLRKGSIKPSLHYKDLHRWGIRDIDKTMNTSGFRRTGKIRYGLDLPGIMSLNAPKILAKFLAVIDKWIGTDLLLIYTSN